jgi:hypothetical protein
MNSQIEADPAAAETFPQLIRAAAARYGDEVAITFKGDTIPDDSATFSQLESGSGARATGRGGTGAAG